MMSMPLIVVAAEIRSAMERALGELALDADFRHAFFRDPVMASLTAEISSRSASAMPWRGFGPAPWRRCSRASWTNVSALMLRSSSTSLIRAADAIGNSRCRTSFASRSTAGWPATRTPTRLAEDPTFRMLASRERRETSVALTSTLHWFETDVLTEERNYQGLTRLNTALIQRAAARSATPRVTLDIDSSESPVHGA